MKVPTKFENEVPLKGVVTLSNYAHIAITEVGVSDVCVTIDGYWFDAEASREVSAFFSNLANVLEGKPQV